MWLRSGDAAPGAFDDAADFARNDVTRRPDRVRGVPVWMRRTPAHLAFLGHRLP
jgi:hypothetical protein